MLGMKSPFEQRLFISFQAGGLAKLLIKLTTASKVILTCAGGFDIPFSSSKFRFLMFFTAAWAATKAGSALAKSLFTTSCLSLI